MYLHFLSQSVSCCRWHLCWGGRAPPARDLRGARGGRQDDCAPAPRSDVRGSFVRRGELTEPALRGTDFQSMREIRRRPPPPARTDLRYERELWAATGKVTAVTTQIQSTDPV
ncbi:hypothetical protein SKAU_G00230590 [Synaphobranchus kaupii]|uniref:Uncharacterized protein n=1 Tax=Synaphobranchus kaupii TaxID=118154 RepID=A0A9Q1F5Q4_SYNKA|nr:hypothetical protein SKAU_G00230590 [Synaphobranchus kaupii]